MSKVEEEIFEDKDEIPVEELHQNEIKTEETGCPISMNPLPPFFPNSNADSPNSPLATNYPPTTDMGGNGQASSVTSAPTSKEEGDGPSILEVIVQENGWNSLFTIILGAEIGVLVRIGIDALNTMYNPVDVFASMYSELFGCIIMGIAVSLESRIRSFYLPIYPLLTTGMAGSVTTFSSWNQSASEYLTGLNPLASKYFFRFSGFITVIIVGFGMSAIGFLCGKHIGIWIDTLVPKVEKNLISKPRKWDLKNIGNLSWAILAFDVLSLAVILIITALLNSQRQITISILFAPFGASLRWIVALWLNPKYLTFPLGTFAVNIVGSVILSLMYVLPFITSSINQIQCDVIYAIQTGFCACLTTVSSFQNELFILANKNAYLYGFLSILVAQIFQFIINASVSWTIGNQKIVCLTY